MGNNPLNRYYFVGNFPTNSISSIRAIINNLLYKFVFSRFIVSLSGMIKEITLEICRSRTTTIKIIIIYVIINNLL